MSRLTTVIAPLLRENGLDVHEVEGTGNGGIRELVVTNPRFPFWGRIVIDREGFLEWDHWGEIGDNQGATEIAQVIIGVLASGPDGTGDRYGKVRDSDRPPPEGWDRPHP
jgi:hypothetical protein